MKEETQKIEDKKQCKEYTQGSGRYASFSSGERCKRKALENGYCKQHNPTSRDY